MMNPKIKALWVSALRSKEYRKGIGYLASDDGDGIIRYCCLGVLCKLAEKAGVVTSRTRNGITEFADADVDIDSEFASKYVLPGSVIGWAGLNMDVPRITYQGERVGLTDLNDGRGEYVGDMTGELFDAIPALSFNEIAKLIEAQF